MEKLTFEGLQPEILLSQSWLADFADAYAEVLNDCIRWPAYQIETIRSVTEHSDPQIIKQSLTQIGFNLPYDFIQHNYPLLAASVPQLALYSERSGTEDYTKLIQFVLGRSITTAELYTEDYKSFYTEPHGPLQIEGGTWFKTTHIELGMQLLGQDSRLAVPRGQTLKDRFLEMFYEFAPWSIVVENFYFHVDMTAKLYLTGCVFKHPTRYIDIGDKAYVLSSIRIEGPREVSEATEEHYRVIGVYQMGDAPTVIETRHPRKPILAKARFVNGTLEVFDERVLDYGNQSVVLELGVGEFGVVISPVGAGEITFFDMGANLEGGWGGATWAEGDIGTEFGPITVQRTNGGVTSDWYLYRTDFEELGLVEFSLTFEHADYRYDDVTQETTPGTGVSDVREVELYDASWSSNRPGLITLDNGRAAFGNVSFDTNAVIYASINGHSASASILVRNDLDRITSLEIIGDDEILAGESAQYNVIAHTVGGDEPINLPITCISPHCTVDSNVVSVNRLEQDALLVLSTELKTSFGKIKASKRVLGQYRDFSLHVTGLRLFGPDVVDEDAVTYVECWADYSDGSSAKVLADWASSCGAIFVEPDGRLVAGKTEATIPVRIAAHYQDKGIVYTATHDLEFRVRVVSITALEIQGNSQVIEETNYRFIAVATFSDGTRGVVDADWTTTHFSIDEQGTLYVGQVGVNPVNLTIKANVDGYTARKDLVAIDTPVTLLSISINGPDNIKEGTSGHYQAFARYSNGRELLIEPEWSLRNNVSWASIDQNGTLTFASPQEGIVEIIATYRFGGRLYTQGRPVVLIPKTKIIRGLVVSGPSTVYEHERVMLTATAIYSDGSIETVDPVWSVQSSDPLNAPDVAADIVSPGLLQGRAVDEDTKVIAVARYFREIVDFELTVLHRTRYSPDVPVSSRIIGPAAFNAAVQGSYAQAVIFEECPNELLVSSTWSIDTDPSVAIITDAGFVRSVNGRSVTATITATYECGNFTLVDSMLINIIGQEDVLHSLEISGPDSIIGEQFTLYQAYLRRVGSTETERVIAEWSIVPQDGRVIVNAEGQVYALDASETFTFTLKAVYKEGFETVTASKDITVLRNAMPVCGVGPIGIRNDPEIANFLTTEISTNRVQQFTLHAEPGQYMYVCYPVALGLAQFRDLASDFIGGWDGATWPDDGTVGEIYGPLTVQRTINGVTSSWYLYRTDFDGIGTFTYELTLGN